MVDRRGDEAKLRECGCGSRTILFMSEQFCKKFESSV